MSFPDSSCPAGAACPAGTHWRLAIRQFALAAVAMCGLLVAAEPASLKPSSDEPSAHNPCFDQPGLWSPDVKKTAYYQQKWTPARLLVYAQKGSRWNDPENWLENGKPATKGPDKNTDVLFPDGKYTVKEGDGDHWETYGTLEARHLTIGTGVELFLRAYAVTGNFWVRKGARWRIIECLWNGTANSFSRNDMEQWPFLKIPQVNKFDNGSVEVIGTWGNVDGLYVNAGKLIIGPDSAWYGGDRHQNTIGPKASLILMSGAKFQTHVNKNRDMDLDIYGELLAGTAERPLQKDATISLSYKSRGRLKGNDGKPFGSAQDFGLVLRPAARLAVTSGDPTKARLVFNRWASWRPDKDHPAPTGLVQIALLGKLDVNGISFDHFDIGGIELPDPSAATLWKNVTFGKDNAGKPDEIFTKFSGKLSRERLTP